MQTFYMHSSLKQAECHRTVGQNKAKCSQFDSTAYPAITYLKMESRMFVLKLSWEAIARSAKEDWSADLHQNLVLFP